MKLSLRPRRAAKTDTEVVAACGTGIVGEHADEEGGVCVVQSWMDHGQKERWRKRNGEGGRFSEAKKEEEA